MEKTWKSVVAGVFDILAGAPSLVGGVFFLASGAFVQSLFGPAGMGAFPMVLGILMAISGILAITGGIYAFRRKKWGLALTGSIFALFPNFMVGVLAIVFTSLSKNEFE